MLPNACFLGFTGTPVFKSQLPTIQRFGGLIGTAYTIDQAVADKAVVSLLYEGRHVKQHVDQISIDEWFRRYTAGLTDAQRADLAADVAQAERHVEVFEFLFEVVERATTGGIPWLA